MRIRRVVTWTVMLLGGVVSARAGETLYNGIVLPDVWPPKVEKLTGQPMPVPYLAHLPAVIPIDVGRQLFVDDFLVEQTDLKRAWHRAEYHAANPVVTYDQPWETVFAMPFSDGVWWDPSVGRFRMWYLAGSIDITCLAESVDGVKWNKPELDVVQAGTNIVLRQPRDSAVIWMDLAEQDEARRFKLFLYNRFGAGNRSMLQLRYSPDGIRWREPVVSTPMSGDRTTAFYNPFRKMWVLSQRIYGSPLGRTRTYLEAPNARELVEQTPNNQGLVAEGQSVFWTGADDLDPRHTESQWKDIAPQLYNLDAVAYESLLLGQFSIWTGPDNSEARKLGTHKRCDILLGFSRDGFHWDRPCRERFIPASWKDGTWNFGNIQSVCGSPLVVGDKLYFYVSGRAKDPSGRQSNGSTGLATLRRDGFASMDAGDDEGQLTTRLVTFNGKHLFVNVACARGALRAEVLDREGNVIEPFTKANCEPISADKTLVPVEWKADADLALLAGNPVKFRFTLNRGSLYSFWMSPNASGASHGYVAGGGPGFTSSTDKVGKGSL